MTGPTRARILAKRYASWWRLPSHIGYWIGGPPSELRCWRTTPEGRQWQAELQAKVDAAIDAGWRP